MARLNTQHMSQSLMATLSWLEIKRDYYERLKRGEARFLLVEGKTDERLFVRNLYNDDVIVCAVGDIFQSQDVLRQNYSSSCQRLRTTEKCEPTFQFVNSKNTVIEILMAFRCPQLLNISIDASDWNVYGVVDSDYSNESETTSLQNLFLTDTHDIETLLLMTDETLLNRILNGLFSDDDIKKAYYLSYQLAILRTVLYADTYRTKVKTMEGEPILLWRTIKTRLRNMQDRTLDSLIIGDAIDVTKLIGYVYDGILVDNEVTKWATYYMQDKRMKDYFDANTGKWKERWDTFQLEEDFYQLTQGHDIARFLRYVTRNKRSDLSYEDQTRIRNMEFLLVENYCLSCLKKSQLGINLINNRIWKDPPSM